MSQSLDVVRRLVTQARLRDAGRRLLALVPGTEVALADDVRGWLAALAESERRERQRSLSGADAADDRVRLSHRLLELVNLVAEVRPRPVFLSYHHGDADEAVALRDALVAAGIEVVMDRDHMEAGRAIDDFVSGAIRDTQATVLLLSEGALRSGWVGLETRLGLAAEQLLPGRVLIACSTDGSWLEPGFQVRAQAWIDDRLATLEAERRRAFDAGGSAPVEAEQARLGALRQSLGSVLEALRGRLCIDLRGSGRAAGLDTLCRTLLDRDAAR